MKYFLFSSLSLLLVLFVLLSLDSGAEIDLSQIFVSRINQHPFLKDHGRQLEIKTKKGALIDKIKLYTDPGAGCKSAIFLKETFYIFVDCNGMHYYISRQTGKVVNAKWNWKQNDVGEYLGTYKLSYENMYYELEQEEGFHVSDLYQSKNPSDPSGRFRFEKYTLRRLPTNEYFYESDDYETRITMELFNDSIFHLILDEKDMRREINGTYLIKKNVMRLKVPKRIFIFDNSKNYKKFNGLKIRFHKSGLVYKGKTLKEVKLAYKKNPDYIEYMNLKKKCGDEWDLKFTFAVADSNSTTYRHYLRLYNYKKGCDEVIPFDNMKWNYKDSCSYKKPISEVYIYWASKKAKFDATHLPEDSEKALILGDDWY